MQFSKKVQGFVCMLKQTPCNIIFTCFLVRNEKLSVRVFSVEQFFNMISLGFMNTLRLKQQSEKKQEIIGRQRNRQP